MKKIMIALQVATLALGSALTPVPARAGTLHVERPMNVGCVDDNAIILCPYYNPGFPALQWFFCYCYVP